MSKYIRIDKSILRSLVHLAWGLFNIYLPDRYFDTGYRNGMGDSLVGNYAHLCVVVLDLIFHALRCSSRNRI